MIFGLHLRRDRNHLLVLLVALIDTIVLFPHVQWYTPRDLGKAFDLARNFGEVAYLGSGKGRFGAAKIKADPLVLFLSEDMRTIRTCLESNGNLRLVVQLTSLGRRRIHRQRKCAYTETGRAPQASFNRCDLTLVARSLISNGRQFVCDS